MLENAYLHLLELNVSHLSSTNSLQRYFLGKLVLRHSLFLTMTKVSVDDYNFFFHLTAEKFYCLFLLLNRLPLPVRLNLILEY